MKRFLLVLLLTAGCSTLPADLRGSWGGEHIGLTIADGGSSLTFDCASGSIPGEFTVDESGTFSLNGTYTPGVGGPEPLEPPPTLDAVYSGYVTGQSMTLTVDIAGDMADDVPDSTYTLRQGEPPQILACL